MTSTFEVEAWAANVERHADERLDGPRDPGWWYTGPAPVPGECPGIDTHGKITSVAMPDLSRCSRADVLAYFDNTWTLHDVLFAGLRTAEAFYRPPAHNLRHPMIFYYGHTAALYVNKLRVAGLVGEPLDGYLEQILETGVDENSWDDMSKNDMSWPSVSEVHDYRAAVYATVRGVIESTAFAAELGRAITMDDPAWALFLAFEHDRIHLETSSVLIRELPIRLVQPPAAWPPPAPMRRTTASGKPVADAYPVNDIVPVPGQHCRLGKPHSFPSFGWDNEYGAREHSVDDFAASRFLVSNGEFHEFVADGGYRLTEPWSAEGERWRRFGNSRWPRWWVPAGPTGLHTFRLRTIFEEIDMPWNWPVCVNVHEAKAFCAWRSAKDGAHYRLPTEAEFRVMRDLPEQPTAEDDPVMRLTGTQLRAAGINLGLAWGSECPVDSSRPAKHGLHDVMGNLWTWSEDTFSPLDGFATHPYYEDFSVPSFDGEHQLLLGGAYISSGDTASIWGRHFFRPHFLQQAGIRLVSARRPGTSGSGMSARHDDHARLLLMHYGSAETAFGSADHLLAPTAGLPEQLAWILTRAATQEGLDLRRVLDIGCTVGGLTFALAKDARTVVGVDSSQQYIATARRLAAGETVLYDVPGAGTAQARLPARGQSIAARGGVEFLVADGTPPATPEPFDAVVLVNLLDRIDVHQILRQLSEPGGSVPSGALLLVADAAEADLAGQLASSGDLVWQERAMCSVRQGPGRFTVTEIDITVWRKR